MQDRLVPLNALEASDRMAEAAAQAGGGVRVRKADIEAEISEVFYVMGDAAAKAGFGESIGGLSFRAAYDSLQYMTICIIRTRIGFSVVGTSAPMDPRNFDPIVGKQNAYENAFRQLWPLMAFAALSHRPATR